MAFRLLALRRMPLAMGVSIAAVGTSCLRPSRALRLDSRSSSQDWSHIKKVVVGERHISTGVYKQITGGSVLGLASGLAVSTFSSTLAFVLGLVFLGVQFAASRGVNLIPYERLQKYTRSINLRNFMGSNMAFKLSFGTSFALAAFAQL